MRANLPYHALFSLLGLCALLMLASLFGFTGPDLKQHSSPPCPYAPGYYLEFPRIGLVRFIPHSGSIVQSPAVFKQLQSGTK